MNPQSSYYNNLNFNLLDAIDAQAMRVCEFGCGSGALARAYRKRNPQVHYLGVDREAEPLAQAADALDASLACDLNAVADWLQDPAMAAALPMNAFDVVVFGDVLEHLYDPEAVLRQAVQRLRPGGQAVASIPNVQFWPALLQLIHGHWPRADSGLFDRTHIRWFTLRNMRELFEAAGLTMSSAKPCYTRESEAQRQRRERTMALLRPLVQAEGQDFDQFVRLSRPLQFLLIGRKPVDSSRPGCSRIHPEAAS